MNYLKIKNKGLIEPQAIYLVGASTKRKEIGKIGQFGSGNKFALAYLLRNHYELKIFSGTNEIQITTTKQHFRGQDFDVICVDGKETSITTEMGKDWELWQSIREIYCNSIDEGEAKIELVFDIEPKEDETHFYIPVNEEIQKFMANFNNYFSTGKKVLFECEEGKILQKTGTTANIYRRGVLCLKTGLKSAFDYDFTNIEIDENRLVKYSWQVDEYLWKLIFKCNNQDIIKKILNDSNQSDYIESTTSSFSTIHANEISDGFMDVITSNNIAPSGYAGLLKPDEINQHIIIPTKVYQSFSHLMPDERKGKAFRTTIKGAHFREFIPHHLHEAALKKAMEFFKEAGFDIPYDIEWVEFDNRNVMGCAFNGKILISPLSAEKGVNDLVNTIIEEYIHLKYDVSDETREFQTAAITEIVNVLKMKNAFIL